MKWFGISICLVTILFFCFSEKINASNIVEIKVSNYFPITAKQSKICEEWIKSIEEKAKGKVRFSYFGAGSLLTATRMIDGVLEGISDIGLSNFAYTPGRFPVCDVLNLPLGFPNAWVATHVANDFYKKYRPKELERVHVLTLHSCGPKFILARKKPILKIEDFKGVTLRGYGYEADLITALGGTPRSIAMPETYDALLKGVVEGATMPLESLKQWRLAEVIKYVTECWEIGKVEIFYLVMNKSSWDKLPSEVKKLFDEYPFENKFAEMWYEVDQEGKQFGIDKGVTFYNVPKDELPRWQNAANEVIEKYIKSMVASGYNEKEVREWIKFIKERIDFWRKKQRESGI